MCAPALALAAFEVAIRRGRATFAGRELVGVHRETHRTAGFAPVEAGVAEHPVEPFGLGFGLDGGRAGYHERAHSGLDLATAGDIRRDP